MIQALASPARSVARAQAVTRVGESAPKKAMPGVLDQLGSMLDVEAVLLAQYAQHAVEVGGRVGDRWQPRPARPGILEAARREHHHDGLLGVERLALGKLHDRGEAGGRRRLDEDPLLAAELALRLEDALVGDPLAGAGRLLEGGEPLPRPVRRRDREG